MSQRERIAVTTESPRVPDGGQLRVLVVITRGEPGGAQVHVLDLVRGLSGRITFHVAVGDDEFLSRELRLLGVPVHVLPLLQREVSSTSDLGALRALRALIATVRPHVVHTHSTKAGILGRFAARAQGVPAIHTAHAWSFSDGIAWRRKAMAIPLEALAGRWTRRFIVVSEADREVGTRYRVARNAQVRIVHNGVCDVPERARPDASGPPVLTMVARMAAPKDPLLLLRALAGIDAPFTLRLIGDGPDRPRIEAAVRDLGLAQKVELLGVRADVPALLASSHLFALVSRQEGFPLAVLEAMRAGLPVVASDVGGVREAVGHGTTGLLVKRDDEAGLRAALLRLIGDRGLRGTLGAAGRRAYEARFTAEHMLEGTAEVYRELAETEGLPQPHRGAT
ncbi:MAG: glycosyltransferase family 4 protein [Pseudomonadota bacterium]|nr:glycosyltransferase family 4 protein [Pseudomonadota bacterium]